MEIDGMVDTSVLSDGRVVEGWKNMWSSYSTTQPVINKIDTCNARIDEFLNMLSKISEKLSGKECEELSAFIDGCISEFKKNNGDS